MGLIRTILIAFAVAGWCAACGGGGSAGDIPPPVTMLSISTISLPPASEGVAYPATALQASGGTSPYTWTITSGALPAGMSLSTDGTLSGTTAATGSWNFIVQATDASLGCHLAASRGRRLDSCSRERLEQFERRVDRKCRRNGSAK